VALALGSVRSDARQRARTRLAGGTGVRRAVGANFVVGEQASKLVIHSLRVAAQRRQQVSARNRPLLDDVLAQLRSSWVLASWLSTCPRGRAVARCNGWGGLCQCVGGSQHRLGALKTTDMLSQSGDFPTDSFECSCHDAPCDLLATTRRAFPVRRGSSGSAALGGMHAGRREPRLMCAEVGLTPYAIEIPHVASGGYATFTVTVIRQTDMDPPLGGRKLACMPYGRFSD
jgi:hypothetical protein